MTMNPRKIASSSSIPDWRSKINAAFLISPYSSGLADAAAVVAEQYSKIMITTGAASDSTYQRGFTMVYQVYTPASRYLNGAVDLLEATDPSASRIAIIHENDKFSTDVANAVKEYAIDQGYEVVFFEGYDTGTSDFAPFINKIESCSSGCHPGRRAFPGRHHLCQTIIREANDRKNGALLVAPPRITLLRSGMLPGGSSAPASGSRRSISPPRAARKSKPAFLRPRQRRIYQRLTKRRTRKRRLTMPPAVTPPG